MFFFFCKTWISQCDLLSTWSKKIKHKIEHYSLKSQLQPFSLKTQQENQQVTSFSSIPKSWGGGGSLPKNPSNVTNDNRIVWQGEGVWCNALQWHETGQQQISLPATFPVQSAGCKTNGKIIETLSVYRSFG